jgi:hypothetical protein
MGDPKQPGGIMGQKARGMGQRKLALVQSFQKQSVQGFQARNSGCILEHVRIGLAILRPAYMVGRHDRDIARCQMMP